MLKSQQWSLRETTIAKTPAPLPFTVVFVLESYDTLLHSQLIARGTSRAAAVALIEAITKFMPIDQIGAGTTAKATFDRQIDFYGREVVFPLQIEFKNTFGTLVVVTADQDGNFVAALSDAK